MYTKLSPQWQILKSCLLHPYQGSGHRIILRAVRSYPEWTGCPKWNPSVTANRRPQRIKLAAYPHICICNRQPLLAIRPTRRSVILIPKLTTKTVTIFMSNTWIFTNPVDAAIGQDSNMTTIKFDTFKCIIFVKTAFIFAKKINLFFLNLTYEHNDHPLELKNFQISIKNLSHIAPHIWHLRPKNLG